MRVPNRCRLVIVMPGTLTDCESMIIEALSGGDVASVIVTSPPVEDVTFQATCATVVPAIQRFGAAVVIAGDTRVAGRCNADGMHLDLPGGDVGVPELREAIAKYAPDKIVGAGSVTTRHMALSLGEADPDYVFFGKLDGDIKPAANPKLLALAEWWSEMVEVPGICMGGQAIDCVVDVAATGADFVALSFAIFSHEKGPKEAVKLANRLLDDNAPEFDHE